MTTAELIAKLREIDPEGVEEVAIGGNVSDSDFDAETVELVNEVRYSRITGGRRHAVQVRYVRIAS